MNQISKENSIVLSEVKEGKIVTISGIEGGWDYRKRITGLGFVKGCEVRVIKNEFSGPMLVEVKGSKVALGRGESGRILVVM